MKDIKTKEHGGKPKVKNPDSRMPKELIRSTVLQAKEKSHQIADARESGMSEQSANGYATDKLESAEEWTGAKAGEAARAAGRKVAQKSYEKIRQRKHGEAASFHADEAAASQTAEPAGTSLNPGRTSARGNTRPPAGERAKEAAQNAAQKKIRVKQQGRQLPIVGQKYSVKTAPRNVKKATLGAVPGKLKAGYIQSSQAMRQTIQGAGMAKKAAERSLQTTRMTVKGTKGIAAGVKAGVTALAAGVKSLYLALGAAGAGIALFMLLVLGIIGGAAFAGNTSSAEAVSAEVLAYTSTIQRYATQYGIPEYVPVIQAIMMQESGGRGTDPMQSSECPYNTRYSNSPNAIQDPDYSIQVGVQYYASCVDEAGCDSPTDMDKLKLSLQGYNYGNGYITWAIRNYGGYSEANALQFSQEQAAAHGWARYGDPEYVPHVLRYYSGGNLFADLFGNDQIVSVAKAQLGNAGGEKFWSWYGYEGRVAWCACFVSWCSEQSGLIASGAVPKFSYCPTGITWFQSQGKWQERGYTPTAGTIIFFDWEGDGVSDHVGIVEKCENGVVYTVEGNSGDAVRQQSYDVNSSVIVGYGMVSY